MTERCQGSSGLRVRGKENDWFTAMAFERKLGLHFCHAAAAEAISLAPVAFFHLI